MTTSCDFFFFLFSSGQSLDALELLVSTAVQKHPQKVINLLFKTLEGQKIISSCTAGEPSEGVGRAKVTQETEGNV